MSATLVTAYASSAVSTTHNVSLSGKTVGKDLLAVVAVFATPTLPSPWTELATNPWSSSAAVAKIWRLAAADNTSAVTTLPIALNGARALSAVVFEDYIDTTASSIFASISTTNQSPTTATPALQGTGVFTFTTRGQALAIFGVGYASSSFAGDSAYDYVSYDNAGSGASFAEIADTGEALGTNPVRLWAVQKSNVAFTNAGVTATANGARTSAAVPTGFGAVIAYNPGTPPPNTLPVNTTAPAITGTTQTGQTLTSTDGTWTGFPTPTYSKQWKRSSDSGTSWSPISGATASTYVLQVVDEGNQVKCTVTATNVVGAVSADSNVISPAVPPPTAPTNTVAPAVTGVSTVGQVLTCSTGTWTGTAPITYTYQWRSGGTNLSGATSSTYTIQSGDVGNALSCLVTASNTGGGTSQLSNSVTPTSAPKLTIAQENALAGAAAPERTIAGAGDLTNQGFCREFSANVGTTVHFACHGDGSVLDIYRIGWYGGLGWSAKKTTLTNTPTIQPDPTVIANSNGATTCTGWSNTASWTIPTNATPGLYVGVLRNAALNNGSYVPFVVRDDGRSADIMYKTSDTTWALAYNYFGTMASPLTGASYYGSGGPLGGTTTITGRVHAATYHRPIVTRQGVSQTYWLACEAPMIRYLERMGYDVTYSASKDWRNASPTLAPCKAYVSSGHDEYWSQGMRDNWVALRNAGKHLVFFSANEVFWRTRWDASGTGGDIMWCFKDTMPGPGSHGAGVALDPVSWTGAWKDTRVGNDATRAPENTLTGTDFRMNGVNDKTLSIGASDAVTSHAFWRGTNIATNGLTAVGVIGFEGDEMKPTQPSASVSTLAATTLDVEGAYADDNGQNYSLTDANFHWGVVSQRYSSGALVVGFGTCQWSWGLDATHDRGSNVANVTMQQATANLLADLGAASPATPISGVAVPTPVSLNQYGVIPGVTSSSSRPANLYRLKNGVWELLTIS